jgi:hypothetical protein
VLPRLLQKAGWRPVRGVFGTQSVGSERFWVWSERFGDPGRGPVYSTLLHEGAGVVRLPLRAGLTVFPRGIARVRDRLNPAATVNVSGSQFSVTVGPGQLRVRQIE